MFRVKCLGNGNLYLYYKNFLGYFEFWYQQTLHTYQKILQKMHLIASFIEHCSSISTWKLPWEMANSWKLVGGRASRRLISVNRPRLSWENQNSRLFCASKNHNFHFLYSTNLHLLFQVHFTYFILQGTLANFIRNGGELLQFFTWHSNSSHLQTSLSCTKFGIQLPTVSPIHKGASFIIRCW